jgi:hypothetical protein
VVEREVEVTVFVKVVVPVMVEVITVGVPLIVAVDVMTVGDELTVEVMTLFEVEVETEVLVTVVVFAEPDDAAYAAPAATRATTITIATTAGVPNPCLLLKFIFATVALRSRYMALRIILWLNIGQYGIYECSIVYCGKAPIGVCFSANDRLQSSGQAFPCRYFEYSNGKRAHEKPLLPQPSAFGLVFSYME